MALAANRLLHPVAQSFVSGSDVSDTRAVSRIGSWQPASRKALSAVYRTELQWSCDTSGRTMPKISAPRAVAVAEAHVAPAAQRLSAKFAELKDAEKVPPAQINFC